MIEDAEILPLIAIFKDILCDQIAAMGARIHGWINSNGAACQIHAVWHRPKHISANAAMLDNYQEDVQGGFTNDDGEISLSLVDESGEAFEPSIRQEDEEGSTPAAGEDNPAVVRKTVPVNKEKYEHLVIAGTPQEAGEGEEQKDAAPFGQLSASLAPARSRICVARSFSIGGTPIYSVKVPVEQVPVFKETVSESGYSFVEPDPCRIKEEANDPHYKSSGLWKQSFDNQWAMKRAGFGRDNESYWKTKAEQRRNVVVAVIDSGLDWYHPDFPRSSLWRNEGEIPGNNIDDDNNGYIDDVIGWNFIDNNKSPWDHDGHGTFVAGVIAAGQNNGIGISGIAPSAKIMVLKALDTFGQGHASMVAEAIAYATDNGAEIINLSLGGRGLTQIEQLAVDHARTRGVLIVVAAGNAGKQVENFSPAGLDGVITVAASDRNDKRAGFSNWGRKIDISAPGVDVLSLRARKTDLLSLIRGVKYEKGQGIVGEDRAYYRASGTSFAAPFVTATAAEIMARDATLDADDVRRMILNSAKDAATPGFDNYTGYGLLDGQAALSADPAYFLESRIDGIKIIKKGGKAFLRVSGTIDADQFKGARIQLGKGSAPKKWLQVNKLLDKVVKDGILMDLPAGFFKGAKEWTIRIITEHGSGAKRESRFKLKLG
jgi:subtilisin family serine protease